MSLSASPSSPPAPKRAGGFDRFGLARPVLRGLREVGFAEPRPIQSDVLPDALQGRDVLGLSQTGTGKTAAFAIPLIEGLLGTEGRHPGALVLAPTRELATQIHREIERIARFTHLRSVALFGGVALSRHARALREAPDIVVGCPGRILDLMGQKLLRLHEVEMLVLDEADHMFDMGFLPDLRRILAALPDDRQNLLFSATMPGPLRRLADDLLDDPKVVQRAPTRPAETIEHALCMVPEGHKRALLEHLLAGEPCESAIVFTRTKHRARRLSEQLGRKGHRAVGLQGNMSQAQRDRAMDGFRRGDYDVLVATDIAARGLDVSGVSHVINFDVPDTAEAYTHRIGRTGRSGCAGTALTFVTDGDRDWLRVTERSLGSQIPRRELGGFEPPARAEHVSQRALGRGGRRSGPRPSTQRSRRNDGGQRRRNESEPRRRNGARRRSRRPGRS